MTATTTNEITINAPLDTVWNLTNNVATWPELFSEYAQANILDQTGNTTVFELVMHPDENGTTWRWTSQRTTYPTEHKVYAHRVHTGPFEYMQIYWEYHQLNPTTTLMRWQQTFKMKPTAPLNDTQMTNRINTNTTTQMNRIKTHIETTHNHTAAAAGA